MAYDINLDFTYFLQFNDSRFYIVYLYFVPKENKYMSKLWNWIDKKELSDEGKIRIFLFVNCFVYGIAGFVAWTIIKNFAFNSFEYALSFIGYATFFLGYVRGFIFLSRQK